MISVILLVMLIAAGISLIDMAYENHKLKKAVSDAYQRGYRDGIEVSQGFDAKGFLNGQYNKFKKKQQDS